MSVSKTWLLVWAPIRHEPDAKIRPARGSPRRRHRHLSTRRLLPKSDADDDSNGDFDAWAYRQTISKARQPA